MIKDFAAENQFLATLAHICLVDYYETKTDFVFESSNNQSLVDVLHILSRWGLDREKITQPIDGNPCIVIEKDSFRSCCVCGEPIIDGGYCDDGGYRYFCGDDCLSVHYTDEQWEQECENNDQSYWTEWESPYYD